MRSELQQPVCCNHCSMDMTVQQAFDDAGSSWPPRSWIDYRCRHCEKLNVLQLAEGVVIQGILDGVPGPLFVPVQTIGVRNLIITKERNRICLHVDDLSWDVPAKPPAR